MSFTIGRHLVGEGYPCFVIAEVGQNHDGSLGAAHAYIDAVAKTGANAVKFQTHIASEESTTHEPFRVNFSYQDSTRYEYWRRMEFTTEQWAGLADHAADCGLVFLSSPFSQAAVELLDRLEMAAWKIASGEVLNPTLLNLVARTRKPVLLSSGMTSWEHLDRAVEQVAEEGAPFGLFQCTTAYPCPPEKLGLNVMDQLRRRYECPVGLSDHSSKIYPGLAAATLGANMLEVHVTLSRECFGPDVIASVTTAEFAQLVEGIRFIECALRNPVDKVEESAGMEQMRSIFGRSIVARGDLPAGHRLALADIAFKKPGTGMSPARIDEVINRRLRRSLSADTLILEEDLD